MDASFSKALHSGTGYGDRCLLVCVNSVATQQKGNKRLYLYLVLGFLRPDSSSLLQPRPDANVVLEFGLRTTTRETFRSL